MTFSEFKELFEEYRSIKVSFNWIFSDTYEWEKILKWIKENKGIDCGTVEVVAAYDDGDDDDGEGDGRLRWYVFSFPKLGLFVKYSYVHSSWGDNYYEGEPCQVKPIQKMVTVYV